MQWRAAYLRIAACRDNQACWQQFARGGNIILVTSYPQEGSTPARTRKERHGAKTLPISFPGQQARRLIIVPSQFACFQIYKDFSQETIAISDEVVVLLAYRRI